MNATALEIQVVVDDMFGENTYIAHLSGQGECVVVDPGFEPQAIIKRLEDAGLTPAAILITHGHVDHIAGNATLKERWPDCPLVIGAVDAPKLTDPYSNLSRPFGMDVLSPAADQLVEGGGVFRAAGLELEVLEAPGHSAGHVVFLWKGGDPWVAFVGDVIFQGGVGRSDFPDSNPEQLLDSIRSRLYSLPDTTQLLSGHGPATTVGDEKRQNPWVRG